MAPDTKKPNSKLTPGGRVMLKLIAPLGGKLPRRNVQIYHYYREGTSTRMVDWPPATPQLASLGITPDTDDTTKIIEKIRSLVDANKLTFKNLSVSLILELR